MSSPRRIVLPLLVALAALALGATLTACGGGEPSHVDEGEVLKLGELEYTVTFSRYLNPNDNEDAAYLAGQEEPQKENTYFGIFLEVQNDSDEIQSLPESMLITDAEGAEYEALTSESEVAFPLGGKVEPEEQVPVLDSLTQQGPIEASVVLFELDPEASATRPLTLHVESPTGEKGEVELDL